MPVLTTLGTLLAGVETGLGVETVVDGYDAILVSDPAYSMSGDNRILNYARDENGHAGIRVGARQGSISFTVEVTGSSVGGLQPRWTTLLLGCGMANASGTFSPITANAQSLTLYLYFDKVLHKLTGAMGTFSLSATAGDVGKITFTFTGLYTQPEVTLVRPNAAVDAGDLLFMLGLMGHSSSQNTPDTSNTPYDTVLPPLFENADLTLDGNTSLFVESFSFDMGNEVRMLSDTTKTTGFRGARIVSRQSSGGINPELSEAVTFWSTYTASSVLTFSVRLGSLSNNRLLISAPFSQISGVGYSDRDGLRTFDLALAFCRGPVGDDEFTFVFD